MLQIPSMELTAINVSGCPSLLYLNVSDNQLTGLDVSANTALEILHCNVNLLESLDVSANTKLTGLEIFDNNLDTAALDALFNTLPFYAEPESAGIWFEDNPGYDDCNKALFEARGWVEYFD